VLNKILPKVETSTEHLGISSKSTLKKLLKAIWEKTFNARVGFAVNQYRSRNLQRGGKSENNIGFRTELSVKTQKKEK
jgi:hypothetical protein